MTPNPAYGPLLEWCRRFAERNGDTALDGAAYDLPGQTVYHVSKLPFASGGRIEINLTEPAVRDRFSWVAELTIDHLSSGIYKHVLLQTDGCVVETYGKQVTILTPDGAAQILDTLTELAAEES